MIKEVVFTQTKKLKINTIYDLARLEANEVRIRSICSLMSIGTENIIFNGLYDPGTHWANYAKFPFKPGYSMVGEIIEVGEKVTAFQKGDQVAVRHPHCTEFITVDTECVKIPSGINPEHAAWFGLAKIAYVGAKVAQHTLQNNVLIIGAGPIGQMSTRWAVAAGAKRVVVVDPELFRIELARKGGAHDGIAMPINLAQEKIIEAFHNNHPDTVIDTTGSAQVFDHALNICGKFGKVVILGDTGSPSSQKLNSSLIQKGLAVIGAHDCHIKTNEPYEIFFSLLKENKFSLEGINTHHFTIEDAASAYDVVNRERGKTIGVIFRY